MNREHELRELVNLVPLLAKLDGLAIDEAARQLNLDEAGLLRRMQQLSSMRFGDRDSGELIDCWIEEGRLHVHVGLLFDRVVRLTPQEMLALLLGSMRLREQGLLDGGGDLERLLTRIEDSLGTEGAGRGPDLLLSAERRDPHVDLVRRALAERRLLRLWYYSAGSDRYRRRDVEVWSCFRHRGHWYFQGHDRLSGETRTFRVDRIGEGELLAERVTLPEPDALPRVALGGQEAASRGEVRLFGAFARIAEEQCWPDLERLGGELIWRPGFSDADSLLRALLPHADNLHVLGPASLRQGWEALLAEMLARHGGA